MKDKKSPQGNCMILDARTDAANLDWIRAARLQAKADQGDQDAKSKLDELQNTEVIKVVQCPLCGSLNTVPIVCGMPDSELGKQVESGKIKPGGCLVGDNAPDSYCRDCNKKFFK